MKIAIIFLMIAFSGCNFNRTQDSLSNDTFLFSYRNEDFCWKMTKYKFNKYEMLLPGNGWEIKETVDKERKNRLKYLFTKSFDFKQGHYPDIKYESIEKTFTISVLPKLVRCGCGGQIYVAEKQKSNEIHSILCNDDRKARFCGTSIKWMFPGDANYLDSHDIHGLDIGDQMMNLIIKSIKISNNDSKQ